MDGTDVALAGVLSTALVGSLAIVFGYFNSRSDRRHARQLAHDERLFARRADLYVDLLDFVYRQAAVAERTFQTYASSEMPPPPLPEDEVRLLQAGLAAFRSPAVLAALEDITAKGREFFYEIETLRGLEEQGQGTPRVLAYRKLDRIREETRERIKALEDEVGAELTASPGS